MVTSMPGVLPSGPAQFTVVMVSVEISRLLSVLEQVTLLQRTLSAGRTPQVLNIVRIKAACAVDILQC